MEHDKKQKLSHDAVCRSLGRFVWYYPAPAVGNYTIASPGARTDGKPLDGTIIGVNDDETVEVRVWAQDGTPHELDKVAIYDGKIVAYPLVVYPEDDEGRIKQEAEKAKHDAEQVAKAAAAETKAAVAAAHHAR